MKKTVYTPMLVLALAGMPMIQQTMDKPNSSYCSQQNCWQLKDYTLCSLGAVWAGMSLKCAYHYTMHRYYKSKIKECKNVSKSVKQEHCHSRLEEERSLREQIGMYRFSSSNTSLDDTFPNASRAMSRYEYSDVATVDKQFKRDSNVHKSFYHNQKTTQYLIAICPLLWPIAALTS